MRTVEDYVDWMAREHGWKLFLPAGVAEQCGLSEQQTLVELRRLVAVNTLTEHTRVYCSEGHVAFLGPTPPLRQPIVGDLPEILVCQRCDAPSFDPDDYYGAPEFHLK